MKIFKLSQTITSVILGAIIDHPSNPTLTKCTFGDRLIRRFYRINTDQYTNIKYCNKPNKQGWYQFKLNTKSIAKLKELNTASKCCLILVLTNIDDACVITVDELLGVLSARYEAVGYEKVVPIMVNPIAEGFEVFANKGNAKNKKVGMIIKARQLFPSTLFTA